MKYKLLVCVISIIFTLSSCMFPETSVENLVKPQKLEQEQQDIYDAFINDIGNNTKIELLYPNSGEYSSSFIVEDIDNSDGNEAIVLYKNNNNINDKNTISVNIIDKNQDNKWHSVWVTHETEVIDVDKFFILNSKAGKLIVIGYNIYDSGNKNLKRISVMKYDNNSLQRIYSLEGNEFEVADINNNDIDDLVIISDKEQRQISVYEYKNNSLEKILSKSDKYDGYKKISMKTGYLSKGIPAIYLDETSLNGNVYSDIIYYQDGELKNLNDINNELKQMTKRSEGIYLYDIDKDNSYEIPVELDLVGGDYYDKRFLIKWLKYDYKKQEIYQKSISYVDMKQGYRFDIPNEWLGYVTYKKDDLNNEVTFYIYNYKDNTDTTSKLLKIKTFVPDINNADVNTENYTIIDTDANLKYGYILYNTDTKYDITRKDINKLFNKL